MKGDIMCKSSSILRKVILVFFFFLGSNAKNQTIEQISAKVDSLSIIEKKLEQHLSEIKKEKTELLDELNKLKLNDLLENRRGIVFVMPQAIARFNSAELKGGSSGYISKNDTITIIDYFPDTHSWQIMFMGEVAYIPNIIEVNNEALALREKRAKEYKSKLDEEAEKENEKYKKIKKANEVNRLASLTSKFGQTAAKKILEKKIWIGMTKEMAVESWGMPQDINRTVGSFGIHEQWIYGNTYLYFEDGKLTSWQD